MQCLVEFLRSLLRKVNRVRGETGRSLAQGPGGVKQNRRTGTRGGAECPIAGAETGLERAGGVRGGKYALRG